MTMPALPDGLTAQQRRFVDEYLLDLNANAAAQRAGYTGPSAGKILLDHPYIVAAIDKAKRERALRSMISADAVLEELAKIAFSDIRRVARWGSTQREITTPDGDVVIIKENAVMVRPLEEIDENTTGAIAEIVDGRDGVRVKMYDKPSALVQLGKHLGIFKETLDVNAKVTAAVATQALDEETFRKAARELLKSV